MAVRRPTPTVQEITTGRTTEQLLAKLRAERNGVEAVPCSGHLGCVDLRDPRYPDADGLHLTAAEWQEFAEAIKAGKYDELTEP